jgi:hypothetical protein
MLITKSRSRLPRPPSSAGKPCWTHATQRARPHDVELAIRPRNAPGLWRQGLRRIAGVAASRSITDLCGRQRDRFAADMVMSDFASRAYCRVHTTTCRSNAGPKSASVRRAFLQSSRATSTGLHHAGGTMSPRCWVRRGRQFFAHFCRAPAPSRTSSHRRQAATGDDHKACPTSC